MDSPDHYPSLTPPQRLAHAHLLRQLYGPLDPPTLAMKLQRAGVTAEGLRPYRRFLRQLFTQVVDTYLAGQGVCYTSADRQGHFAWCWAQALRLTSEDGCRYGDNEDLQDYLRAYLYLNFYEKNQPPTLATLDRLLNPEDVPSRYDVNTFLELWAIFEKTPRAGRRLRSRARIPS